LSNVDLRNNRVFNALPLGSLPALSIVDLRGNRIENFVHVHPVIGKSYLGNNPICSFPQPLTPQVAEACKREPSRILDVNIHVFDELAVQPLVVCPRPNCLQLQPHVIVGPLIHQ
jgi:hypothetical protein